MFRHTLWTLVSLVALAGAAPTAAQPPDRSTTMTTASPGHATVNGLDLYYEIHGTGSPAVLLHGGVNPAETFGAPLAALARRHRVIAVHLQGHGRTKDVDRPLRYESMADDVAALLGNETAGCPLPCVSLPGNGRSAETPTYERGPPERRGS